VISHIGRLRLLAIMREEDGMLVGSNLAGHLRDAADEIERLRDTLDEIALLHNPTWASPEAEVARKEPWVCELCGVADGSWPCVTRTIVDRARQATQGETP
jgi:hypothetical protein